MKYAWYHCNDLIATDYLLENLIKLIRNSGYVQPNMEKLMKDIADKGKFIYALGIFKVEKI